MVMPNFTKILAGKMLHYTQYTFWYLKRERKKKEKKHRYNKIYDVIKREIKKKLKEYVK